MPEPLCRSEKSQVPSSLEASGAFEQIRRAAELIMDSGSVHELRSPKGEDLSAWLESRPTGGEQPRANQ